MELRPEFQLKTVIKALVDVVLPAVATDNLLAQEQGRLAIAVLRMIAHNRTLMFRYDYADLSDLIILGTELSELAGQTEALATQRASLAQDLRKAQDVLGRAQADPGELVEASHALRETTGAIVTAGYRALPPDARASLAHVVTGHAAGQLLRERALIIDQGWEADPASLPSIETLVAPLSGSGAVA